MCRILNAIVLLFIVLFVNNTYGQSLQFTLIGGYGHDTEIFDRESTRNYGTRYGVHTYRDHEFTLNPPTHYGLLLNYQFCKEPIFIETGFTITNRRIFTGIYNADTKDHLPQDIGSIFNLYSIPLRVKFVLNPSAPPQDWTITAKIGADLEWMGKKTDNPYRNAVVVVDSAIYREFAFVEDASNTLNFMGGLDFEKKLPKKFGVLGFGFQFGAQWYSLGTLNIWGYNKVNEERIDGYDPFIFQFSTISVIARYTLPWKVTWGKKSNI